MDRHLLEAGLSGAWILVGLDLDLQGVQRDAQVGGLDEEGG